MKYLWSTISLIIGLFINFLVFTQAGESILQRYSIDLLYLLIASLIALAVAIVILVKKREKWVSILAIIANLVFIVYFLMLFTLV